MVSKYTSKLSLSAKVHLPLKSTVIFAADAVDSDAEVIVGASGMQGPRRWSDRGFYKAVPHVGLDSDYWTQTV